jgi:hypothetical protein
MALDQTKLRTEFAKVMDADDPAFVGFPDTTAQAADNWANAYHTYALDAEDVSGDSFLIPPVAANFSSTLAANLPPPLTGTAALAAAAFEAAFVAYWTPVTFNILELIPPPPFVPACPNIGLGNNIWGVETTSLPLVTPGVILASLTAIFLVNTPPQSEDVQTKIDNMTNAFHTATTTAIIVTIVGLDTTPPAAGPLAISNVCTIF